MATSPIYSWPEPDNTDLVKNGALAIRTLGNAIDTTMATMTPKSIVDAKGDLITATANDTPARIAVGNNGESLIVNTETSTGLSWQGSQAAGKNVAINGAFDWWQRGTSFSITAGAPAYTADRWTNYFNGTGTIAQDSTNIQSGSQYSLKVTATGTSASNAIFQLVEYANVVPLQGKVVTLSYYAMGTVGLTPAPSLSYSTTANDTLTNTNIAISGTIVNSPTFSGTLQRYGYKYTIPANAKTLRIGLDTGAVVNTNFVVWNQVQLEIGSMFTTFTRAGGTIQGELAACQRYFQKSYLDTTAPGTASTTQGSIMCAPDAVVSYKSFPNVIFPVQMRGSVTVTIYNPSTGTAGLSTGIRDTAASTNKPIFINNTNMTGFQSYVDNSSTNAGNQLMFHYTASSEL
jgi:hypothetical protein